MNCILISLFVTACGGGGGGGSASSDTPNPEPPPSQIPSPTPVESFELSGTITASASQAVDGDTNDPAREAVSNDTPASAQTIPNPITLGGYVNRPGNGAAGRSFASGDIDDFYRVELLAGQRVTMLVAEFESADADLVLWNAQGDVVLDVSDSTGDVETLLIKEDGTYLVNTIAFEGATNYILAIGTSTVATLDNAGQHTIVPWEAVVKYRDNTDPVAASTPGQQRIARDFGLRQRAGGRGRGRLMALESEQHSRQRRHAFLGGTARLLQYVRDPDLRARWETMMAIKTLRGDPLVEYAEPNYRVRTMAVPNDEAYPLQWHYPLIGLPEAWDTTTGDSGVIVAVIDTGILADHPDLAGQLVDGYDFVRDPASALDGDGIDPNPRDPGSFFGSGSSSFHGTHTSGTVVARGNNREGVVGVAYTSRVMPLRALGSGGGGTSYDVDQAVRFAAGLPNDSDGVPQQAADIINLSLGGAPFSQSTQNLLREVREAGVMVVAAAGNQASSSSTYPAAYEGVIAVSAVDLQRRLTSYSNTGPHIDVAAPGGNNSVDINGDGYPDGILSTSATFSATGINFVYAFLNGTSMAAPHVAGILALMKSVNPDLSPADVDALLAAGELSDNLGPPGRDDQFGHGLINAQRAVLAALTASGNSPADNPRLVASTSSLNFGSNNTALDIALLNGGKSGLELQSLSVSQPWIQITPLDIDAARLGNYQVRVQREGLTTGIHTADINAQSSINNLTIRVFLSVGTAGAGADVGVIYILLYDPASGETVAEFASGGNNAEYPFRFTGIPAGAYEIVAGSDADNDLFICDAGEACGAWLTIDQPIRIQLDSDRQDFNFPVEYLVSIPRVAGQAQGTNSRRGLARRPSATEN